MKAAILVFLVIAVGCLWWRMKTDGFCGDLSMDNTAKFFVTESMKPALTKYRDSVGHFPSSEEGIAALLHAPQATEQRWHGPYIEGERVPRDPWGREYQYRSPALKSTLGYDLWSLGPDGVPSADDIGNWTK